MQEDPSLGGSADLPGEISPLLDTRKNKGEERYERLYKLSALNVVRVPRLSQKPKSPQEVEHLPMDLAWHRGPSSLGDGEGWKG